MDITNYYSMLQSDLLKIINAICETSIEIENHIRYGILHGEYKDQLNSSGDVQKKLDIVSNDIMIKKLTETNSCNILLSEENEDPIIVSDIFKGKYLVAFDPLDGSSNIDCNGVIGTIFSICENNNEEILIKGNQILVAGYIIYGPSTELVITVNDKVDRFILNSSKEYMYIESINSYGKNKKIYSINESNVCNWNTDIKNYIDSYKNEGTKYTARYVGSMVADVHRTLMYGGIFCYPADKKNPNGKLRLLYECYPMAKLFECAGGQAIVGNMSDQRILDVEPLYIHQRTPILLGFQDEIKKYKELL